jgi:prepilin peptidase CpaA
MDSLTIIAIAVGSSAVWDDLRHRTISNWISLTGVLSGLTYHSWHGGWHGLVTALEGAALGLAAFLVVYALGGMGGGDVKLMAAFGSLLGPLGILTAVVLICGIGGLMAAASLLVRRQQKAIPYGPAIVLGSWLALFAGR